MPEPRDIALVRWGEALRRDRSARRSGRFRLVGTAAAMAATAALATLLWPPRPSLVWNASTSSPLGLYSVETADGVQPGDMAVAWAPAAAGVLAAERHYLPSNVPLVKHVAATAGDRVCAVGDAVFINGRFAASRWGEDPSGRRLPSWTGCEFLREGQLFLLVPGGSNSFDGRYFGVTEARDVIGEARLIWAR